jgi:hypothetical protein
MNVLRAVSLRAPMMRVKETFIADVRDVDCYSPACRTNRGGSVLVDAEACCRASDSYIASESGVRNATNAMIAAHVMMTAQIRPVIATPLAMA